MELCWVLPVNFPGGADEEFKVSVNESIEAEKYGFSQVLISSLQKALDPWVLASYISSNTKSIRMLVAQNTNLMIPTVVAKAASSLSMINEGRIDLNIVTGSSKSELSKDTFALNHKDRYVRTREFTEILHRFKEGTVTYDGNFYSVSNASLYPQAKSVRLFIAGSSDPAMSIAADYGDVFIMYAQSPEQTKQKFERVKHLAKGKRDVRCGIYIDLIARETKEEAWIAAKQLVKNVSPIQKKINKLFYNNVDSVGHLKNREYLQDENHVIDNTIWTGLSQISPATSLSIVGSYDEVVSTLNKYNDLGTDFFVVTASCNDNELQRIGENIIPKVNSFQNRFVR